MKYQPDNKVMTSFELWFNDHLLRNGEAFSNETGNLSASDEETMTDANGVEYQAWIMPKTQWVYDATIPGVVVPTTAIVNNASVSNVKIDTTEGKVWVPSSLNPQTVSASFSAKDFEIRVSSESEESILFGDDPSAPFESTATKVQDEVGFPFAYLKYSPGKSQGLWFGGGQITKGSIRAVVVADSQYLFDGINILFRDTSERYFPILEPSEFPFDEFGALKTGSFDYRATVKSNPDRLLYYIKDVNLSPFTEDINSKIALNALGGFIDFRIESLGYPHARFV